MVNSAQDVLLSLLAENLFHSRKEIPDTVNWEDVYKEARMQAVPAIVFADFPYSVNEELRRRIENSARANFTNNVRVTHDHTLVHTMLGQAQIPYVILKGCASASYYEKPVLRGLGDVDFLVSPDEIGHAGEVLESSGFEKWEEEHVCHIVYRKGKIHLEMHFEPSGIPSGEAGEKVRSYLSDTIETAIPYHTNAGDMMIPDAFHHGLIILIHTSHHMTGEGIGLRHLCDWAVFAHSVDVPGILKDCLQDIGMWRFAQLLTQLSVRYLGMPKQEWAMEDVDDELLKAMMDDILGGGNFGHKDKERSNQAYLISSRGKHGVGDRSMLAQLVTSMNEAVLVHMPLTKKYRILLPLGWIIVGGRQVWLIMSGKRKKMNLNKMVTGARERKRIYEQFGLFEHRRKR